MSYLVVRGCATGIWRMVARYAAQYPAMHRTAPTPTPGVICTQMSTVLLDLEWSSLFFFMTDWLKETGTLFVHSTLWICLSLPGAVICFSIPSISCQLNVSLRDLIRAKFNILARYILREAVNFLSHHTERPMRPSVPLL